MKIEGLKEVSKQLEKLGAAMSGKAVRAAVGYAVTPVVRDARRFAPKGDRLRKNKKGRYLAPGFLSRSIKKSTFKSRSGMYARASVGVAPDAWYGPQLVERGYTATDKNKVQHKQVAARPFLTRAFDANKIEMQNRFAAKLKERIDKVAK